MRKELETQKVTHMYCLLYFLNTHILHFPLICVVKNHDNSTTSPPFPIFVTICAQLRSHVVQCSGLLPQWSAFCALSHWANFRKEPGKAKNYFRSTLCLKWTYTRAMRAQPMILVMLLNTSFIMLLYRSCLGGRGFLLESRQIWLATYRCASISCIQVFSTSVSQ